MLRIIVTAWMLLLLIDASAQELQLTAEEKAALDSMFKNDAFMSMLNEKKDSSYAEVSVAMGNAIFSLKNNSLNAGQATTSKIYYAPSVGYFHKSGLALALTGFVASDNGRPAVYQYAVSPSYNYLSKKLSAGVSYTRYIKGSSTGFDVNPFQNDLYANVLFKKFWLQPSVAVGYAAGRTKEYFDSAYLLILPQQPTRVIHVKDTITSRLSSFSMSFSISHEWEFKNIFLGKDELVIQPAFMINGSNQKITISHSNSLNARRPFVQKLLKIAYGDGISKERFSLQSAAFLLSLQYGKGKFILQPQLYMDYYLQQTNNKRLSILYSLSVSFAF